MDARRERVEGEAVEDAHDDGDEELAVKVGRIAPVLCKCPLCKEERLLPHWSGELATYLRVRKVRGILAAFVVYAIDFSEHLLLLLRLSPLFAPIDLLAVDSLTSFHSRLKDELGNIAVGWTVVTAIGEVFDDVLAILTNRSKVKHIASWVQG